MAGDNKGKLLREAERYVLQGKLAQAINEYLKIIKADPTDALTLNTIGDLYLHQGKFAEARKYFAQVAEHYARNNFLLKAIAVYRKILSAEPDSCEINLTLATLYARQGLTVEARNQYLKVAEIYSQAGKTRESLECYEKAVELDPMNSSVQLRLAEIYEAEGSKEKAHSYFSGAARAQAKAGDLQGAIVSYRRAAQLNPINLDTMKGFLEVSLQTGDVPAILEQLKKSVAFAPADVPLKELLGRAYLAAADPENASKVFQEVIAQDGSHYLDMFRVSNAFLKGGDLDQAASCLDSIIPTLISRRETDKGIEAYNVILEFNPHHVLTLTRLATLYSATNNLPRYVDTLKKVVGYYLGQQSPGEALEYILRILHVEPDNERVLSLHHQAFAEAFPDKPYKPPFAQEGQSQPMSVEVPSGTADEPAQPEGASSTALVELDLLLTYGMTDKALEQLRALEAEDPWNKEVRRRLMSLYKETKQHGKAAEQSLMLAALYRKDDDDASAQKAVAEARKMAPELVDAGFDLDAFAQRQGIVLEHSSARPEAAVDHLPGIELDLSGDLSEMFFKDAPDSQSVEESEESEPSDMGSDEYVQEAGVIVPSGSIEEQLQEVDFYIRLGFYDEARAKLDELSKDHPNNPELPLRYRMLPASSPAQPSPGPEIPKAVASAEAASAGPGDIFQELKIEQAVERVVEDYSSESRAGNPAESLPAGSAQDPAGLEPAAPHTGDAGDAQINTMFADLIDEVNSLTDQEIAREDFETHFNLGIAYREMDLLEDAIREFQHAVKAVDAAKFHKEVVQCCGMLSTCFLDKGMPRSAIRWCQTGLNVSEVSSHEAMALRYDMGVAYSATGDAERALECFGHIFGADPSYRDVAQKIDCLRGSLGRHDS